MTAKSILNLLPRVGVNREGMVRFDSCDLMKRSNASECGLFVDDGSQ